MMADIVKLQPKTPSLYDPRADQRDDQAAKGHPVPDRTAAEQDIWDDWVKKGRPERWPT